MGNSVLTILIVVVVIGVMIFGVIKKSGNGLINSETDAKRFARLVVMEIKLYNEQKVIGGLSTSNLNWALRDEIKFAREKYNARCSQPQFEKYFDEALVEILASGDRSKMGN